MKSIKTRVARKRNAFILRTVVKAALAVATLGSIALSGPRTAIAQQYTNPACDDANCAMTVTANYNNVLLDPVKLYVVWYGPWSGAINNAIQQVFPSFISAINDSSYQATVTTYTYAPGDGIPASLRLQLTREYFDTNKSQGININEASIQTEFANLIGRNQFPLDTNGVYLFFADNTVSITDTSCGNYCTDFCGCNDNGNNYNLHILPGDLKYAFLGNPSNNGVGCTYCQWNFQTPNNAGGADKVGAVDMFLSTAAHEIEERVTDPEGLSGGWVSPSTGAQVSDECEAYSSDHTDDRLTAEGTTYTVPLAGGASATANFHANVGGVFAGDYMIQTLRANVNGGAQGYCVNGYGGPFWGQSFGYSHTPYPANNGDWSQNNYKGECESGQALVGLSRYTSGPQAHAVMCASVADSVDFQQSSSCSPLNFGGSKGGVQWYVNPPIWNNSSDWDFLYYKGECGENQFVAGVAQSQGGAVDGLLCCTPPAGNIRHLVCEPEILPNSNTVPSPSYDWDYGYYKATCQFYGGEQGYVAGVSVRTDNGQPHAILCCFP